MKTSDVFPDCFSPGTAVDENTVLTDYWLEFVAVREEVEEPAPHPSRVEAEDLHGRIESFGQRIEVLLEDQRKLRKQFEKVICTEPPEFRRESPARDWSPLDRSARQMEPSSHRKNLSLTERFRNSFLYTAIHKLG